MLCDTAVVRTFLSIRTCHILFGLIIFFIIIIIIAYYIWVFVQHILFEVFPSVVGYILGCRPIGVLFSLLWALTLSSHEHDDHFTLQRIMSPGQLHAWLVTSLLNGSVVVLIRGKCHWVEEVSIKFLFRQFLSYFLHQTRAELASGKRTWDKYKEPRPPFL